MKRRERRKFWHEGLLYTPLKPIYELTSLRARSIQLCEDQIKRYLDMWQCCQISEIYFETQVYRPNVEKSTLVDLPVVSIVSAISIADLQYIKLYALIEIQIQQTNSNLRQNFKYYTNHMDNIICNKQCSIEGFQSPD